MINKSVWAGARLFNGLHFLAAALLLVCSLVIAQGQGVGSSRGLPSAGGTNTVKGRVYSPSGKPLETRLKVRLDSPNTTGVNTVTDADGTFVFNNLEAGDYRITIDGGSDFDTAVEYASIYRETGGTRTVNVSVQLQPKGMAAAANRELSSIPKGSLDLYNKALESVKKGDSKKAVEQLKGAIELHPTFALALNELGVQYLKLGEPDKAVEALSAAVKLKPNDFSPRLNYGIALLNKKQFAEAEAQLAEAVKKNDGSPVAHMYLGIALMSQQKLDDAEKELVRAASFNSNEVAAAHRYLGGIYWGKREYQRAADELETYLKLSPKAPDAERTRAAIKDLRSKKS